MQLISCRRVATEENYAVIRRKQNNRHRYQLLLYYCISEHRPKFEMGNYYRNRKKGSERLNPFSTLESDRKLTFW